MKTKVRNLRRNSAQKDTRGLPWLCLGTRCTLGRASGSAIVTRCACGIGLAAGTRWLARQELVAVNLPSIWGWTIEVFSFTDGKTH